MGNGNARMPSRVPSGRWDVLVEACVVLRNGLDTGGWSQSAWLEESARRRSWQKMVASWDNSGSTRFVQTPESEDQCTYNSKMWHAAAGCSRRATRARDMPGGRLDGDGLLVRNCNVGQQAGLRLNPDGSRSLAHFGRSTALSLQRHITGVEACVARPSRYVLLDTPLGGQNQKPIYETLPHVHNQPREIRGTTIPC